MLSEHSAVLLFAVASVAAFAIQGVWLRTRAVPARLPWRVWTLAAVLLALTWQLAGQAGDRERSRIQRLTIDLARLYGSEMDERSHWKLETAADSNDPLYLDLIAMQKRWLDLSPSVSDIYTLRKLPDGRNAFIVDSETDYDRDGKYDEDREQRTSLGEIYPFMDPSMERAFLGEVGFTQEPMTDRWGTWVSAFVPLHAPDGRVEAVLGVDFEAEAFLQAVAAAEWRVTALMAVVQVVLLGASTLNSMLSAEARERQRIHAELLDASRRAGMAEVATGVLHNVGNVLNSVNVAVAVATDGVRGLKLATLDRLAATLQEQEDLAGFLTRDPRGRELPGFLARVTERLGTDRDGVLAELEVLRRHIGHVNEIVAMQQNYANGCGVVETLPLADLLSDSLRMNAGSIERHGLHIVRDYAELPPIPVDRHKVLQILVNLIRNAKDALAEGAPAEKRLTLGLACNGDDRVKVTVGDNGVGIPPENLTRIFQHGFTTRANGHGFGLHCSANAARAMGGSLTAQSDGPGRGATFTLELPRHFATS